MMETISVTRIWSITAQLAVVPVLHFRWCSLRTHWSHARNMNFIEVWPDVQSLVANVQYIQFKFNSTRLIRLFTTRTSLRRLCSHTNNLSVNWNRALCARLPLRSNRAFFRHSVCRWLVSWRRDSTFLQRPLANKCHGAKFKTELTYVKQ